MSADGNWKITMNTPIGKQESTLQLSTTGNTLTGKMVNAMETLDIIEGSVDGKNLAWKANMKKPFPMTLRCTAVIDGDNISGSAKAGALGSTSFSGVKS